ncbi:hypothetical protein [Bifidobacterium gallicum]|uniref:Uncharacterized protein n=1 Tax=Bifidobacterium gallicum DSM 20093 = LMG 11596 TaxID=561180 RepID=D1NTT1_9BIFI|nr:hypothetical protein [Bifidobacterium gallicum]EFA23135.1 hypothetical protein BIFGAL_03248 [Bifidobacterium gallicum DSM 20093 = LMG 11596]KFI58810.1 hypothetical protein BGLCM_1104 [Bifidobacterium gallicum DSM 20093 = LMG 11596]
MGWVVLAIIVIAISAYFSHEYMLDCKAPKLRDGSTEDRAMDKDLNDIARKIDEKKYVCR